MNAAFTRRQSGNRPPRSAPAVCTHDQPRRPPTARRASLASWLVLLLLTLVLATTVEAVDAPAVHFERGNLQYEKGQYTEAIVSYRAVLDSGNISAPVYFNLGNACFKAGQLGQALLWYRQAERLDPRDPDIQANLRFVRTQIQGGPPTPMPRWRRVLPRLPLDKWTLVTATLTWAWLGLWSILHLKPAWRLRLKLPLTAGGLALLFAATGLIVTWRDQCHTRHAVVVQPETILRHGPLDESPSLQTLPDGQELVVLDQKSEWFQVAGASRGVGWLKTNQIALLHP